MIPELRRTYLLELFKALGPAAAGMTWRIFTGHRSALNGKKCWNPPQK